MHPHPRPRGWRQAQHVLTSISSKANLKGGFQRSTQNRPSKPKTRHDTQPHTNTNYHETNARKKAERRNTRESKIFREFSLVGRVSLFLALCFLRQVFARRKGFEKTNTSNLLNRTTRRSRNFVPNFKSLPDEDRPRHKVGTKFANIFGTFLEKSHTNLIKKNFPKNSVVLCFVPLGATLSKRQNVQM